MQMKLFIGVCFQSFTAGEEYSLRDQRYSFNLLLALFSEWCFQVKGCFFSMSWSRAMRGFFSTAVASNSCKDVVSKDTTVGSTKKAEVQKDVGRSSGGTVVSGHSGVTWGWMWGCEWSFPTSVILQFHGFSPTPLVEPATEKGNSRKTGKK